MKNILLVGNGGREHAIASSIYNSKSFNKNESKISARSAPEDSINSASQSKSNQRKFRS